VGSTKLGWEAAIQTVLKRYETFDLTKAGAHFTSLVGCLEDRSFSVYRVPGGKAFDAWVKQVARRHRVTVHLVDTKYSLATLQVTRIEVNRRLDGAAAEDWRLVRTGIEYLDGGYLEVGVSGEPDEARRILADLGDKVRVFGGVSGFESA
jgi:hypothetical protein